MTIEVFTSFLAWCTLINLVVLLIWFFFMVAGGGWLRRMHGKWFPLSEAEFAATHYRMIAHFKLLWMIFNLTPYLALRLFM